MADKVADLYVDLSIRGDDFDDRLRQSKQGLDQMGKAADDSAEKVRQGALKSAAAYERVRTEVDKAGSASRTAAQKLTDATERAKLAADRHADAVKKYGTESDQAVRSSKRLSDANKEIERAHKAAERAADQYTVKQKQAANAAQRAAQEMRRAGNEIDNAMPDGSKLDGFMGKLGALGEKGSSAGGDFGGGFMAGFAPKVASIGSKGGPIGAAIAGVAVVGLAAGALLAKSIADGMAREQMQDTIQAQLGIDEATADRIGRAASNAYMDAWGDSVQGNMETLRALMDFDQIDTSTSQEEMEALIGKAEALNTVLGTDTRESMRGVNALIASGLAANGQEAFDLITAAGQKGLNRQDDLIDSLSEYSTGWKNSGLSAQTALALIDQSMSMGVDNTDRGADAIREFGRRVTEEGDTIVAALNDIGLNGQQMYDAFKEGGPAAEEAFDQAFDKIRSIEDPVKRNQAAMALLGDTAGDFIGAFAQWDPSKAVNDFGQVAGAADESARVMNDNAAVSWESMRRTVEEATGDIKKTMAQAFGPAIADIANGIAGNKDQIASFFADIVEAALDFGIAMGNTAAGFLHVWGTTTGGIADMVGTMVESIGSGMSLIGGMLSHIPGLGGIGRDLEEAGHKAREMGDGLANMGESAHSAANFIADTLVPGMANARDRIGEAGDRARQSAEGMQLLRDSVVNIPDDKTVIINDNSPEAKQRLEDLGFIVTTLPDGSVRVEANTVDAEAKIAQLQKPGEKWINIRTKEDQTAYYYRVIDAFNQQADGSVRIPSYAGGKLPDQAVIQSADPRGGLIQWAEPETQGEAFIPLASSKRSRSTSILREVADRFGYSLFKQMADGGIESYGLPAGSSGGADFPDWIDAMGTQYGVTPSTYAGHQESNRNEAGYAPNPQGLNRGIDWSGSVGKMQAFAEAMLAAAPSDPSIEQIIWQNPETGQKIGWHGRTPDADGSYFAGDYAGHQDHVHTRFNARVGAQWQSAAAAPPQIQEVQLNPNSSREDVARKIISEGRKRGYSDDEIKAILATSMQESNLSSSAIGGGGAHMGIFQQDSSYAGRGDPNTQVTGFYDRLDEKKNSPGSGDIWEDIFWLQQRPGESSAQSAVANGRGGYMTEIRSREGEAATLFDQVAPTVGTMDPAAPSGAPAGVQQVYVVGGHLDGATSAPSTPSPSTSPPADDGAPTIDSPDQVVVTTPLMNGRDPVTLTPNAPNMRRFALGDVRNGHQAEMVRPGDYRLWGEPESGGESYIPHAPSNRARSLRIWAETGRILGVPGFKAGGFGGYTADTRDASAPKNLYDLLALGAGLGFMGASVAGPYIGMAQSGNWTLGDLAPTVSSSANDIPGVSNAVREQTEWLQKIFQAVKEGKVVVIQGDDSARRANVSLTRTGR
jgi:phage-related minor tail protein